MTNELMVAMGKARRLMVMNKLGVFGFCLCVFGMLFVGNNEVASYGFGVEVLGLVCFGYWFYRKVRSVFVWLGGFCEVLREKWLMRFVGLCSYGCCFVLGRIQAKNSVSTATGLPAGDFPVINTILTSMLSVCFYMMGMAILLAVIGVIGILGVAIAAWVKDYLLKCVSLMADLLRIKYFSDKTTNIGKKYDFSGLGWHVFFMALIMIGVACLQAALIWGNFVGQSRFIRWAVYWTDYDLAKNYPGIRPNTRFRLHDNGVVSYAIPRDGDVIIQVSHVGEQSEGANCFSHPLALCFGAGQRYTLQPGSLNFSCLPASGFLGR